MSCPDDDAKELTDAEKRLLERWRERVAEVGYDQFEWLDENERNKLAFLRWRIEKGQVEN